LPSIDEQAEPLSVVAFLHRPTDDWQSYGRCLDPQQHHIGKSGTQGIERCNLNFRTRLKRLQRRTICFSRSTEIMKLSPNFMSTTSTNRRHTSETRPAGEEVINLPSHQISNHRKSVVLECHRTSEIAAFKSRLSSYSYVRFGTKPQLLAPYCQNQDDLQFVVEKNE
jgi:hypothetical protein